MTQILPQSSAQPLRLSAEQKQRYKALLDAAVEARERAYAPNSKSQVGAAVLGASGEIYTGVNCEFTRFADHGEQVAINQAVLHGEGSIEAVAVFVAPQGAPEDKHFHGNSCPCGNCRQALFELNPDMVFVQANGREDVVAYQLRDLLPQAYRREWPRWQPPPPAQENPDALIQSAMEARSRSLAVRTGYPEGAAIETDSGQIFSGTKVELSSYASQPERMALAAALMGGHKNIKRIAIVGGSDPNRPETPPNVNWDSLQALARFNPHIKVVHPDAEGAFRESQLTEFMGFLSQSPP